MVIVVQIGLLVIMIMVIVESVVHTYIHIHTFKKIRVGYRDYKTEFFDRCRKSCPHEESVQIARNYYRRYFVPLFDHTSEKKIQNIKHKKKKIHSNTNYSQSKKQKEFFSII